MSFKRRQYAFIKILYFIAIALSIVALGHYMFFSDVSKGGSALLYSENGDEETSQWSNNHRRSMAQL